MIRLASVTTSVATNVENVITTDTTYTIAASGADFTEPGALMEWLQRYRIAFGVTVTATIASGTYVCTKQIIGHIDGRQLVWTNGGFVSAQPTIASFDTVTILNYWRGMTVATPGIQASDRASAETACRAIVAAAYPVILQFPGSSLSPAFAINNLHSGDWSDCPCIFENTGTNDYGIMTGDDFSAPGNGPGGVGIFDNCCVIGFENSNVTTCYGGIINVGSLISLFSENYNLRCEFGGTVRGSNAISIGAAGYGWRANHGGWGYLTAFKARGNAGAVECTNTTSMAWMQECDIQFNWFGITTNVGGSGIFNRGTIKNNLRNFSIEGYIDAKSTDQASTETFDGGVPLYAVSITQYGAADITGTLANPTTISGVAKDIYLAGNGMVTVDDYTSYDPAEAVTAANVELPGPDLFGNIRPLGETGRATSVEVEISGTTLTIPSPCPYSIGIVQPSGSAGTAITINTIVMTNVPVGQTILLSAPNAGSGEVVTINDSSDIALRSPSRYLSDLRDSLELARVDESVVRLHEVAYSPNGGTTSSGRSADVKRVRVVTAAGAITSDRTDDIVVVNKNIGAASAVALNADQNFVSSEIIIKDGKGDAAANNITITPAAGKNIDGAGTYVIAANYGRVRLSYNGTEWNVISA